LQDLLGTVEVIIDAAQVVFSDCITLQIGGIDSLHTEGKGAGCVENGELATGGTVKQSKW
jgi:hypothetical protein